MSMVVSSPLENIEYDMNQVSHDSDPSPSIRPPSMVFVLILLCLLMTIHGLLVYSQIIRSTPTLDEVAHLPAGQSYLEQQTFRMYRHSPPLARIVAALAAWPNRPDLIYDRTWKFDEPANHWRFAFEVIANNAATAESRERYLTSFDRGRCAIALWSVLTIPFLFAWGNQWFGRWAGLLAASLWTLSPNILAHAGLVTTDLAATSAGLIACWTFSRWLERPSWLTFGGAGFSLGIAELVKFSSLWLYFIFLFWLVFHLAASLLARRGFRTSSSAKPTDRAFSEKGPRGDKTRKDTKADSRSKESTNKLPAKTLPDNPSRSSDERIKLRQPVAGFVAIVLVSFLVIDAGYLFEGIGTPLGDFPFLSRTLTRPRQLSDGPIPTSNNMTYRQVWQDQVNRFQGTLLGRIPSPLPYHYIAGFDEQKFESEGKYPMYLRGKFADSIPPSGTKSDTASSRRGWWYYYVYALAIKVPLSTWVLFFLSIPYGLLRPARRSIVPLLYLALTPILAMSFLTDINLGLRYVLPSLPFIFLLCGSLIAVGRPRWTYVVAGLAILWNISAIARIHPHELSYFNELVGGPTEGRFHLIDSNIDWGQDLRGLARWLDEHPDWKKELRLGYAGTISPEFEGIENYRLAAARSPVCARFQAIALGESSRTPGMGSSSRQVCDQRQFRAGDAISYPMPTSAVCRL